MPAPTRGSGLLYGGFQGPKAALIQQILSSAEKFPQVQQSKIQELLWAIIARARFKDLTNERKQLAVLLAPKEVALWQADVIMNFPQKLLKDAVDKLPPEAKMIFEAEQKLRDAFHDRTGLAFEELERIAVPNVETPKTSIPVGRWSYHKGGFFTRMIASGYQKTHLEVLVPRKYRLNRDAFGRITHWEDADGYTIDTEYAPNPPFTIPDAPGLKGWLFKSVTYASPDGQRYQVKDKGWVMSGRPAGPTRQSGLVFVGRDLYCQGRIISIQEWQEQRDRANAWRNWYDSFRRQLGLDPPRQSDEDDVTDLGHYGEGLRTIGGSPEDRLEWIAEHHRRQNESLADATRIIAGLGEDPAYDPSGDIALPGNAGAQRLGLSGRGL